MGLVEVRPRTGIRRLPYTFTPAVSQSLSYAIQANPSNFVSFSELRNHVEAAFWDQAVRTRARAGNVSSACDTPWADAIRRGEGSRYRCPLREAGSSRAGGRPVVCSRRNMARAL